MAKETKSLCIILTTIYATCIKESAKRKGKRKRILVKNRLLYLAPRQYYLQDNQLWTSRKWNWNTYWPLKQKIKGSELDRSKSENTYEGLWLWRTRKRTCTYFEAPKSRLEHLPLYQTKLWFQFRPKNSFCCTGIPSPVSEIQNTAI